MDDENKNGQDNEATPSTNKQPLARVPVTKVPADQAIRPSAVDDAATAKAESAAKPILPTRQAKPQAAGADDLVETSMEIPRRIGLTVFILVFVVFGGWAALAPLDGAAHA
ncbi:MAG TPA: hypothetical protein DCS79_03915, partial [Gammaproteobacteria bacterium]|nr:hypothetical protein [Gammaproteobacteria bacterium]